MSDYKRIAIYARVSTDGQAEDGFSIDAQLSNLRSINTSLGHMIIEEYVDRGISGKSMDNRPALLKMLDDAKKDKFDEIVVWKLNRLARSHIDLLKINEVLEKCNVSFRSVTEPFDTSNPAGKLLFNLLGSIGEFERETIVENVKSGMKQRARQGYFNGGQVLGYKSVSSGNGKEKSKLVVVEKEAEVVKKIFELYTKGVGNRKIANELKALGYKTKHGNDFSIHAINDIIMNPTYVGKIRYNRLVNVNKNKRKGTDKELIIVDGNHEPIIDLKTWKLAEEIMNSKRKFVRCKPGIFILSGLIRCPICGSSMVAGRVTKKDVSGKKLTYHYYQCSNYKNKGMEVCKPNSIRADKAEEYVLSQLRNLALEEGIVERIISEIDKKYPKKQDSMFNKIKQLKKEIDKCSQQKRKVISLYENDIIDEATVKDRVLEIDLNINSLKTQLADYEVQVDERIVAQRMPLEMIKNLLKNLGTLLDIASREQQKQLLGMVIEKITINDNKEVDDIVIRLNEGIQKVLNREDSSNEESSSFMSFQIII